jgi:hypothetical protein
MITLFISFLQFFRKPFHFISPLFIYDFNYGKDFLGSTLILIYTNFSQEGMMAPKLPTERLSYAMMLLCQIPVHSMVKMTFYAAVT